MIEEDRYIFVSMREVKKVTRMILFYEVEIDFLDFLLRTCVGHSQNFKGIHCSSLSCFATTE